MQQRGRDVAAHHIEAQAVARELGLTVERARSMNDDPTFIAGIADVLQRRLAPAPATEAAAAG